MAKSHPAYEQFDHQETTRLTQWARSTSANFALLACFIALGTIFSNPYGARLASVLTQGLKSLPLTELAIPSVDQTPTIAVDPEAPKYHAIGDYLANRYRVSLELATDVVSRAFATGRETNLDPLLILAVISIESSFNPAAVSSMGAKGLMQVIPRFHPEKFEPLGGEAAAFDLGTNIIVGAQVLEQYLHRAGDLANALRMYVGATSDETENGFVAKVMTERDRLHEVLKRYQDHVRAAQRQPPPKLLALAS